MLEKEEIEKNNKSQTTGPEEYIAGQIKSIKYNSKSLNNNIIYLLINYNFKIIKYLKENVKNSLESKKNYE